MLVITRHKDTIQVLKEHNIITDNDVILDHAEDSDLVGQDVLGTLPIDKAALCKSVMFIKWNIPLEARGKEWTLEETRKYFAGVSKYSVREIKE